MQPEAFWELAVRLLAGEKSPAGYRTATNRAYYAAFLSARRFLDDVPIALPRDANVHRVTPSILANTQDKDIDKAGTMLANLRDARNDADYALDLPEPEREAFAHLRVSEAADVIGALNTCRAAASRYERVRQATIRWADQLLRGASRSP